jgi:hypothetical protein
MPGKQILSMLIAVKFLAPRLASELTFDGDQWRARPSGSVFPTGIGGMRSRAASGVAIGRSGVISFPAGSATGERLPDRLAQYHVFLFGSKRLSRGCPYC